jgi:hypothetical protein
VLTNIKPTIMVTDIGNFLPAVFTEEVLFFKDQLIAATFTGWEKNRQLYDKFQLLKPAVNISIAVGGFWNL